jgi:hypothetical protein
LNDPLGDLALSCASQNQDSRRALSIGDTWKVEAVQVEGGTRRFIGVPLYHSSYTTAPGGCGQRTS